MKSGEKRFTFRRRSERDEITAASVGTTPDLVRWLLPVLVVLVSVVAFLPVLLNEFVNWDDYETLLDNPHYRGLGWTQLSWMFTTFYMGHYQPLSWLTFGLDYLLWGMDPFGYHLTNLLLHTANAVLFYFLSLRLLSLALSIPASPPTIELRVGAVFAAFIFALHPLRVESVAWVTERRDVLSGLFLLMTVLFYLRLVKAEESGPSRRRRWAATLTVYILSLLSRAGGMTLPVVLLVLDVYPLRRLGGGPGKWFESEAQRVWWEKVPFLLLAVTFGIVALLAQKEAGALKPLGQYSVTERLAQALYGIAFYLWKTVVPLGLSPLYELPQNFNPWDWPFLLGGVVVLAISISLFLARRRWPAGLAIWICYVVILAPVLGIAQSGVQFVADRYSYLSCLGWAMLVGAGLLYCWQFWGGTHTDRRIFVLVAGPVAVLVLILGGLTWKQSQVWHNSETLWGHAILVDPKSSLAHNNLGNALFRGGKLEEAIQQYRQALEIDPNYARGHHNLGFALVSQGKLEEAIQHYRQALELGLSFREVYYNLGNALAEQGQLADAIKEYRQALEIDPNYAEAHESLGLALASQGQFKNAIQHFRKSLELNPASSETHFHLGTALASNGDLDEAIAHFQKAIKIKPEFAEAYHYLGIVMAAQGRIGKAIDQFREAVRIDPDFAEAHESLGQALALQGKRAEAIHHYQEALRILKSHRQQAEGNRQ